MQGVIATCDPAVARTLLTARTHTTRRSRAHRFVSAITPGSRGLLFLEGEPWLRRVRAVTPTFGRRRLDRFGRLVFQTARAHAEEWAGQGPRPDLFRAVSQLGLQHVLRIGYGLDPAHPVADQLGGELLAYKRATMTPNPKRRTDLPAFIAAKLLDVPYVIQGALALQRRVRRLRSIVGRLPEGCPARLGDADSWLERLSPVLPQAELTDELNHLYGAYAAVDYVVCAGLLELSRHPEWRRQLRAEVCTQLGEAGFTGSADFVRLPRTLAFMREVLRLYPVAMMIFRETGEPLTVAGETLPAGTQIALLPYAMHRHPDYWSSPEEFAPERWLESAQAPVPFSYIPFLAGPRKCIGRDLAELVFVATFSGLAGFELVVTDDSAQVLPFVVPRFDRDLPFTVTAAV
jgi:cytochrome P450